MRFETLLGHIEGQAVSAIDHLVERGEFNLSNDDKVWLAVYLAFQLTRGRAHRAEQEAATQALFRLAHPPPEPVARALLESTGESLTGENVAEVLGALQDLQAGRLVVAHTRRRRSARAPSWPSSSCRSSHPPPP